MIDTWLLAALCLFFLTLCAIVRITPGPTRFDRIVALNVAMTIAVAGALVLVIALGNILVVDAVIIIAVIGYAGIFALAHVTKGAGI